MSKYFTSFLNLAILFASISANEMTAYYQKREYFSCFTTPTQKLTSNPASSFKIGGGGGGGGELKKKMFLGGGGGGGGLKILEKHFLLGRVNKI